MNEPNRHTGHIRKDGPASNCQAVANKTIRRKIYTDIDTLTGDWL